ncbi:uncharacterized protein N7498_004258 [Penicillium cinerascens]|uniref:Uncharacterized protein n=1 Tax=Penicillium cinerascens TaxID=70096 RepID=A0A9W9T7P7_9EURO|nr:uncharacterized protein N7498_004258 [Penicillium cinerascens]KAJ5212612.1 hypothetical protein N7498_004258 [Penicillium cinerascens]
MDSEDCHGRYQTEKKSVEDYNIWAQEYLKRTAWGDSCRSWYKNNKTSGQVRGVYPGTTSHFKNALERIGGEDFHIKYTSVNRLWCLGNGEMEEEKDGLGDMAGYFKEGVWG